METTAQDHSNSVEEVLIKSEALFSIDRQSWAAKDFLIIAALSIWVLLLNATSLGALEFFRHTEADRTLIAWEMVEHGDYLVPHLLGSPILTKPPLFYWLSAVSIKIFGSAEEWVTRVPSVIAAVLFVISQFIFLRLIGITRKNSLLGALIFSTSVSFLLLSSVAEIDMLFGLFCGLSIYGSYFAVRTNSLKITIFSYLVMAFAFLTKGPQILFFYAAAEILFFCWLKFVRKMNLSIAKFVLNNIIGLLVFLLPVVLWLYLVSQQVGWSSFLRLLDSEIVERVVQDARHKRGWYFYIGTLLSGLLPWTPMMLIGFIPQGRSSEVRSTKYYDFLVFNLFVVASAVIMLSVSEGKSNRYLFPVFVFAVNLALFGLDRLKNTSKEIWLLRTGVILGFGLAVATIFGTFFIPFYLYLPGVSNLRVILCGVSFTIISLLLVTTCKKKDLQLAFISILLFMLTLRIAEQNLFVPYRNATRSVKPVASNIAELIPPGQALYTIELFERWVVYYLKRGGQETYRLTPSSVEDLVDKSLPVYLLLNEEEELWRVDHLRALDPEVAIIKKLEAGPDRLLLIKVNSHALPILHVSDDFPTVPTPPQPLVF